MNHICQCPPDLAEYDPSGNCFNCQGRMVCSCGHIPCVCELIAQQIKAQEEKIKRLVAEGRLVKKEIFPGLYQLTKI